MNENHQYDLLLKKTNEKKPYENLLNEKGKIHNLKEKKKEIIKRIDDQISKDVILFDRPPEIKSQKGEEKEKDKKSSQNNSFEKEYKQLNTLLSKTKFNPENHLLYLDER